MNYKETDVLTWYVWHNLQHLMTSDDRRIGLAAVARMQAAITEDEKVAHMLLKGPGRLGAPEVDLAIARGPESFRIEVAVRLLADPTALASVRRCPRCNRVARTPKAKQCFWCGHDWHDTPSTS
jgi:hypothetical protein